MKGILSFFKQLPQNEMVKYNSKPKTLKDEAPMKQKQTYFIFTVILQKIIFKYSIFKVSHLKVNTFTFKINIFKINTRKIMFIIVLRKKKYSL